MAKKRETRISNAVLDELVAGIQTEEDLNAVMRQLSKGLLERVLEAEMTEHLGHDPGGTVINPDGNTRNGISKKRVKGDLGEVELNIPRDRLGEFEPQVVKKHQRRLAGLDKKILSLYARGLSTTDIKAELKGMFDVEVSPSLISEITDAVLPEVKAWQARPLEALYPVVYLDCIFVKLRVEGIVRTQAVYVAIAINLSGLKEILGLWVGREAREGATFWLAVLSELQQRGVEDVFIFCVDGLKGFPERSPQQGVSCRYL
jgi:putative transposase